MQSFRYASNVARITLLFIWSDDSSRIRDKAVRHMRAYEFYRHDRQGDHLIAILPERRINPKERITRESVINWIKSVVGDVDLTDIYFVNVEFENSAPKEFYGPIALL